MYGDDNDHSGSSSCARSTTPGLTCVGGPAWKEVGGERVVVVVGFANATSDGVVVVVVCGAVAVVVLRGRVVVVDALVVVVVVGGEVVVVVGGAVVVVVVGGRVVLVVVGGTVVVVVVGSVVVGSVVVEAVVSAVDGVVVVSEGHGGRNGRPQGGGSETAGAARRICMARKSSSKLPAPAARR
jgi:hypothetical protein